MKTNKTKIKELKTELHHWQMIYRMEIKGLKATREKVKSIAACLRATHRQAKMRELQK